MNISNPTLHQQRNRQLPNKPLHNTHITKVEEHDKVNISQKRLSNKMSTPATGLVAFQTRVSRVSSAEGCSRKFWYQCLSAAYVPGDTPILSQCGTPCAYYQHKLRMATTILVLPPCYIQDQVAGQVLNLPATMTSMTRSLQERHACLLSSTPSPQPPRAAPCR